MAGTITSQFSTATSMTISLGSLASSGSVGRISSYVNNTSNLYLSALVYVRVTIGATNPTANTPVYVYLARGDNAGTYNDDNNGTADASGTFINTPLLGVINCAGALGTTQLTGVFDTSPLGPLGPAWGVGIVDNTGGSLHATAGSHTVAYVGMTYID